MSEQSQAELDSRLTKVSISEKRWLRARHILMVAMFVLVVVIEVVAIRMFLVPASGLKAGNGPALGVVTLSGPMMADSQAGAAKVIPALQAAFENSDVKEVALFIDSPGGAPAEAERIGAYLKAQSQKTGKPTVAVISNLGASAAYLTAIHADSVVSGRYSLVGSIGAVVQSWGVDKVLKKLDVEQRVFASGQFKTMLNPFQPLNGATADKVQAMADNAGAVFAADVATMRGSRLKLADYATGEVWAGETALQYGLVDTLGTLEGYAVAKKLVVKEFGPFPPKSLPFMKTAAEGIVDALTAKATTPTLN